MIKTLNALKSASLLAADRWQPDFIRLSDEAARSRMASLVVQPGLSVHDTIGSQLKELVRALNPSVKFTPEALEAAALGHIGTIPLDEYGVWVHYTWSNRLVHLLDEVEFVLVRTDRNRNKITREEQAVLATKRIGVIGLSVGQSIALTMAMERSFGELRLADHDTLDLSNLNRIRSGVHHLGLKKVVNVAREIMEIDPFLKVTLFPEGINRGNIEQFCTDGGKLDVLVDECDSVDVKIFSRQTAKGLGIPVVMDTSDRGMIDVERFDLEPERPILHGLIEHLDPTDAAKAKTNEEKLPFVLPIAGFDTLSARMKASMLEIENSVTTWPQLATSVVLGGAVGGDVCRRMMLGQCTTSGRWFIDLEELTGETSAPSKDHGVLEPGPHPALTPERMEHTAATVSHVKGSVALTAAQARKLAEAGAHAPSAGNNQPWQFMLHEGRLLVFHDKSRSYSRLDGGGLIPMIGLGACLENIALQAAGLGLPIMVRSGFDEDGSGLIAIIEGTSANAVADAASLAAMIDQRCTNRRKADDRPVAEVQLDEMINSAQVVDGCSVSVLNEAQAMNRLSDLVGAAERLRFLNPIGHAELFGHEIRWTPEEAARTRDGLDLDTLELKASERAGLRIAADSSAIALLKAWNAGSGFRKMSGDAIRSSPAAALVCAASNSTFDLLNAGRAVQRLWLQATQLGLSVHPISAPLLLAHHVRFGSGIGFTSSERAELMDLFSATCELFTVGSGEPVFIVRLCHAQPPTARSLRLAIERIFHVAQPIPA